MEYLAYNINGKGTKLDRIEDGLNKQAVSFLKFLRKNPVEISKTNSIGFLEHHLGSMKTAAWYNGRERGFSILFRSLEKGETLVITVAEHRTGEDLVIDHWKTKKIFLNPPTINDFPEEAYSNRIYIGFKMFEEARKVIVKLLNGKPIKRKAYFNKEEVVHLIPC